MRKTGLFLTLILLTALPVQANPVTEKVLDDAKTFLTSPWAFWAIVLLITTGVVLILHLRVMAGAPMIVLGVVSLFLKKAIVAQKDVQNTKTLYEVQLGQEIQTSGPLDLPLAPGAQRPEVPMATGPIDSAVTTPATPIIEPVTASPPAIDPEKINPQIDLSFITEQTMVGFFFTVIAIMTAILIYTHHKNRQRQQELLEFIEDQQQRRMEIIDQFALQNRERNNVQAHDPRPLFSDQKQTGSQKPATGQDRDNRKKGHRKVVLD